MNRKRLFLTACLVVLVATVTPSSNAAPRMTATRTAPTTITPRTAPTSPRIPIQRHPFVRREVVFVDTFGFPSWGWGWGSPYYSFGFGYPYYPYIYGYYPYSYGYYTQPTYRGQSVSSDVVVRVQERLARAGYYHGAIDGVAGPRTRSAIRAYERAHGLRVDGVISDQLLGTMGLRY